MYAICFMSIVLKGIIGRVQTMGGLVWLIKKATNKIKGRKGAQYFIAFFTCILDFCVGSNTVCILICVDVLKPLAKKFKIAPKRFASLLDIFACIIPGISPIGINVMAAMTYGGITNPFQLIRFQFYLFALACMALLTIQFDFLKTKEEKQEVDFYPELDNYNL